MPKSSSLSYPPPFRYSRPAMFDAPIGNKSVARTEISKAGKSPQEKKRPSGTAGKASKVGKPKASKLAPSKAKAKTKKPARKR